MENKRTGIIDHTTTCPHCGHRVLHKNLAGHIRNIHPSEYSEDRFSATLKRTESKEWWDKADQLREVIPLSSVLGELEDEPDPLKKKKRKKYQNYCDICGELLPSARMQAHRSQHVYNQPFRNDEEIHCPICLVNIGFSTLTRHFDVAHKDLPISEAKQLRKQVQEIDYYGLDGQEIVDSFAGPITLTRRNWVKCPMCNSMIRFNSFEKHFNKVHRKLA
jgi:hypothetical protein